MSKIDYLEKAVEYGEGMHMDFGNGAYICSLISIAQDLRRVVDALEAYDKTDVPDWYRLMMEQDAKEGN